MDYFKRYPSNISLGTSNNTMMKPEKASCYTYRIFAKPERFGKLEWRFWYSNSVDSTWDTGEVSHANISGRGWRIRTASVAAADKQKNCKTQIPVLYDGQRGKIIEPDESFWSDSVTLDVLPGEYLCFSWCIECDQDSVIPITPDSQSPCYIADEDCCESVGLDQFAIADSAPIPNLFGAKTEVETYLAFIGDSITQGIGTENDKYDHWVAKIAKILGNNTSVWNLGLGFGRAQDAASNASWLKKAMHYTTVSICLGVNDILPHGSRTKEQIRNDLSTIIDLLKANNPDRKIILFTIPPFDLCDEEGNTWNFVNERICTELAKKVDGIFDIRTVLSQAKPNENMTIYGPHPNGMGGTAVAEAFCKWYLNSEKLR